MRKSLSTDSMNSSREKLFQDEMINEYYNIKRIVDERKVKTIGYDDYFALVNSIWIIIKFTECYYSILSNLIQ